MPGYFRQQTNHNEPKYWRKIIQFVLAKLQLSFIQMIMILDAMDVHTDVAIHDEGELELYLQVLLDLWLLALNRKASQERNLINFAWYCIG